MGAGLLVEIDHGYVDDSLLLLLLLMMMLLVVQNERSGGDYRRGRQRLRVDRLRHDDLRLGLQRRRVTRVQRHPRLLLDRLAVRVALHPAQAVLVFPMHARVVLLHVVRPVELLLTYVALERFVLLVYVLVPGVQVAPVRRVRAMGAVEPLLRGLRFRVGRGQLQVVLRRAGEVVRLGRDRRRRGRGDRGGRVVHRGVRGRLQPAQVPGHLVQHRALLPRFPVRPVVGHHVVVPRQVQADALGVRARVRTLRALEHLDVGVRAQPVFRHAGQQTHRIAFLALEQLLLHVVAADFRRGPRYRLVASHPWVVLGLRLFAKGLRRGRVLVVDHAQALLDHFVRVLSCELPFLGRRGILSVNFFRDLFEHVLVKIHLHVCHRLSTI